VELKLTSVKEGSNFGRIYRVDTPFDRRQGNRTVHRAGIEKHRTQSLGQHSCDGAFAHACRPVNGNDKFIFLIH
jgi:hypothetical protein